MLIVHATDLRGDDRSAFIHATALAAASGAKLVTLHAGPPRRVTPDAGALALRWQRAIDYEFRYVQCFDDTAETLLDALHTLQPSLVVLGTHARHGIAALVRGSVGDAVARNLDGPTLVIPNSAVGFVDEAQARSDLKDADPGRDRRRCGPRYGGGTHPRPPAPRSRHRSVHVGKLDGSREARNFPSPAFSSAIVQAARRCEASVIVMPTHGHDGVGDVFGGSHTERVIHETDRPVLTVPW
jgi:nucleotide-binding universal stress UspA family protein